MGPGVRLQRNLKCPPVLSPAHPRGPSSLLSAWMPLVMEASLPDEASWLLASRPLRG